MCCRRSVAGNLANWRSDSTWSGARERRGPGYKLAGGGRESHCHSACRRETVASGSEHRWCTRWMAVAYSIIANHRGKSPMVFPLRLQRFS